MDYTINPENLGRSVFLQMFFYQFSALLVNFELEIHYAMGDDQERADEEGDNAACEGMMAQEMNHGKCQLLYSRSAEKYLGYPAGYRRFWKLMVYNAPMPLLQSFVAYIEASFIVLNGFLADFPFMYDCMWAQPKWVFAWHCLEETEHCWDSVQDMLGRTDFASRLIIWTLGWILLPVLMLPLALMEGLVYGHKALKSPGTLLWSFSMWLFFVPAFLMTCQACSCLHIMLGMRPSDHAYWNSVTKVYQEIYKPYEHHFKITHSQKPDEHVIRRVSVQSMPRVSTYESIKALPTELRASFSRQSSIRFSIRCSASAQSTEVSQNKRKSIRRFSTFRNSLYNSTQQELLDAGMGMAEIEDAGFGISEGTGLGRLPVAPNYLQDLAETFEQVEEEDRTAEEKREDMVVSDHDKKNI
jgi:hypothetical protein